MYHQQDWGTGKNRKVIQESEEHLVDENFSIFDESDPQQFTQKAILSVFLLFGSRGASEVTNLLVNDVIVSRYPKGHRFFSERIKISLNNGRLRKTHRTTVMKPYACGEDKKNDAGYPVLDPSDLTDKAATLCRYLQVLHPDQKRLWCRVATPVQRANFETTDGRDYFYSPHQPLGIHTVTSEIKKIACTLGLSDPDYFGGQAFRRYLATKLHSDANVSTETALQVVGHTSLASARPYQRSSTKQEVAAILASGALSSSSNNPIIQSALSNMRDSLQSDPNAPLPSAASSALQQPVSHQQQIHAAAAPPPGHPVYAQAQPVLHAPTMNQYYAPAHAVAPAMQQMNQYYAPASVLSLIHI